MNHALNETIEPGYERPRDPVEIWLARKWQYILGFAVGIRENFFGIGGNSLDAAWVIDAILVQFGIQLPLNVLTEQPTAANTARSIAPWATQRRRTNRNMKAIGPWAYRPISLIAVTISLPFAITAACVHKGPMEVLEILETQGDGTLAVWQAALDLLRTPVYRH